MLVDMAESLDWRVKRAFVNGCANACFNNRELDLEDDLVVALHRWYLSG